MTDSGIAPKVNKPRRMVPLRYVLTPFAIIAVAIIILILMGIMAPKPAKKPVLIKAPLVDVMSISYSDITFNISSQGSVVPRTETNLVSEVSGIVTQVSETFFVGGFFTKGEEILRIDDITYQVAVLQAEARLGSAQARLVEEQARSNQAKEEWSLSGKKHSDAPVLALRVPQLQQAQADVKAAEADLKEAKVKLERTVIIAPYDAMIKAKKVDIGQYVTTGTVLATAFAVDYAEVRLPIRHRDIAFLNLPRINQQSTSATPIELYYRVDEDTYHWNAQLARYEGVVDASNRVHYIVAKIDDPYGLLSKEQSAMNVANDVRIGTFVNANIQGKSMNNILAIPSAAVHGANTIYMVDQENKLHKTQVSALRSDSEFLYTQQELPSDSRIILTNIETPIENMKLRVVGEEEDIPDVAPENTEQEGN